MRAFRLLVVGGFLSLALLGSCTTEEVDSVTFRGTPADCVVATWVAVFQQLGPTGTVTITRRLVLTANGTFTQTDTQAPQDDACANPFLVRTGTYTVSTTLRLTTTQITNCNGALVTDVNQEQVFDFECTNPRLSVLSSGGTFLVYQRQ